MNEIVDRIAAALEAAVKVLAPFKPGAVAFSEKGTSGPVTEADRLVNDVLRKILLRDRDEGWFSEESVDDLDRLRKQRVWVVDPLDGTIEFVEGIPEWSVSIGVVENGEAVAGGICNPAKGEVFLGSLRTGVTYNGISVRTSSRKKLEGALVLASRSEVKRGDWKRFQNAPFEVRPVGSVAYKLALVAAGLADATWTLTPKNEWDIAAGVALVSAAGGTATLLDNSPVTLNRESPRLPGLIACAPLLRTQIGDFLRPFLTPSHPFAHS